ncbi:MAG: phosphoenolpyruvate synthase [Syntrophaceae bacterium PtaU1.Bin231]|nr:MAG: phosphoenolpyruvate synthase [Syntrophaceae bacterium PtaU1.Bin231]
MDLVRIYRVFQKMMEHPQLLDEVRAQFLAALAERRLADAETIRAEAAAGLQAEGKAVTAESLKSFADALIDLHFISHFSDEEIDNYINLVRKRDAFRSLTRVVNAEGATPGEIRKALREFCDIPQGDLFIDPTEAEGVRVALINHFISNHLPIIGIAKHFITIRDVDEMLSSSFSTPRRPGKIGGKAAGLLLAHKILLPRLLERDPDFERKVTVPESYYFNSGILSDFMDYNCLYSFSSRKYQSREDIAENFRNIGQVFAKASFPPDTVAMFRAFLERMGEEPLILRSSSLLEDNFGFAFSGKYDSVFLANQGDLETRLAAFIEGFKQVHMSTYAPAPLLYRRDHKLLDYDERMSVLVQKVVGNRYGDYFFPFAAGVAFSQNPYRWTLRIRREDGIVRLVYGLGTQAVDRVGQGYPRLVPLGQPLLRPEGDVRQIMKYSQRMIEVLNLKTGRLERHDFEKVLSLVPARHRFYALSTNRDGLYAPPLFEMQEVEMDRACVSFDNFLSRTPFVSLMKRILGKLENAYGRPVDVEFAWNEGKLFLLQCRTLAITGGTEPIVVPEDLPRDAVLFTNNRVVWNAAVRDIEYVVYVDPKAYNRLPSYEDKIAVGRIVHRLNRLFEDKRYALFGPGRWGSNDIQLGVRVGYEDINRTKILAEIAFEENGATPEVSLGTHFFSDLVEAHIVPVALYPDHLATTFREDFFLGSGNQLAELLPEYARFADVVRVIHLPGCTQGLHLHVYQDARSQKGVGFLAAPVGGES